MLQIYQIGAVAEDKPALRQQRRQIGEFHADFLQPIRQGQFCHSLHCLHIEYVGKGNPALALSGWQQDFFFLAEGFVAVQQGLPKLFFPERLCQIPDGGDLIAPQGHFPIG